MNAFFSLLDDVAAIAKMAAVSLDDIATQSTKSVSNAAGIVIDDTAATPQYVTGLTPDREVPIIWRIAKGSIKNKAVISVVLFTLGLILSYFNVAVLTAATPFLMCGGVYLAYEGYEKLFAGHHAQQETPGTPKTLTADDQLREENNRVRDAIRTDIILSGEILALTFAGQADSTPLIQASVLIVTSILMTIGVYGVVAGLVKMDDLGLALARVKKLGFIINPAGRGLVIAMPYVFKSLGYVGAVAMLWVGGGIVIHGAEHFGFAAPAHLMEKAGHAVGEYAGGFGAWLAEAGIAGILGVALGALALQGHHAYEKIRAKK